VVGFADAGVGSITECITDNLRGWSMKLPSLSKPPPPSIVLRQFVAIYVEARLHRERRRAARTRHLPLSLRPIGGNDSLGPTPTQEDTNIDPAGISPDTASTVETAERLLICAHERTRIDDGVSTCLDCGDRIDCDALDQARETNRRRFPIVLPAFLILAAALVARLYCRRR
jgi:hypothetical protein